MGRESKLTHTAQKNLCKLLAEGNLIADACKEVGLGKSTFYLWVQIGKACKNGDAHPFKPGDPDAQKVYLEFLDAVTRARAKANIGAVKSLRNGMLPSTIVEEITETFTETRLDRNGKSYDYTRTTTRKRVAHHPGDWRAAIEFLKRRDPKHWSETVRNELTGKDGEPLAPTIFLPQVEVHED